jgi:hypothetical protein
LEPSVIPSHAPKQVYALALASLISCLILVGAGVVFASQGQAIGLISAFGALLLGLRAVRTLSTRITEAGVSQLSWAGRVHVAWAEVTQVTRTPLSFILTGDKKRVVVSLEELQDTDAAKSYIESCIASKLSRD